MDLSKLPKLSKTDKPPEPEDPEAQLPAPNAVGPASTTGPATNYYPSDPLPGLAEAWISIALGLLLMLWFPHTFSYLHSPAAFEQANPVTDGNGNPLHYPQSAFFWADLGVTVFSLALLVEGLLLAFTKKPGLILLAFGLTVAAGVFNLFVVIHTYDILGLQIICALAVVVAGYMAMTQWRLIQILRLRETMLTRN